jgi:hypothetical protein
MNTQLKPVLAVAQVAAPVGLHDSVGGEQKNTSLMSATPAASVNPVGVHRLLVGQS